MFVWPLFEFADSSDAFSSHLLADSTVPRVANVERLKEREALDFKLKQSFWWGLNGTNSLVIGLSNQTAKMNFKLFKFKFKSIS